MDKSTFFHIFHLLRVKQWIKNLLVIVPFFAAGIEFNWSNVRLLLLGLASFCIASSIIYIVNDLYDREADRLHESKSKRPIASGVLTPRFVLVSELLLAIILLALLVGMSLTFIMVIIVYAVNSLSYTFFIKKIPVLEFISVSVGFILRGYAGAAIFAIELSSWFLIVVWFSSLYLIIGKRDAEFQKNIGTLHARKALNDYSSAFLRDAKMVCLAAALTAYCSWALYEKTDDVFSLVSIVPATVFFLTYSKELEKSLIESPEVIMLESRLILGCLGSMLFLLYLSTHLV